MKERRRQSFQIVFGFYTANPIMMIKSKGKIWTDFKVLFLDIKYNKKDFFWGGRGVMDYGLWELSSMRGYWNFPVQFNSANLEFLNQAKNIPVVLQSSPNKIWGKSVKWFMVHDSTEEKGRHTEIATL